MHNHARPTPPPTADDLGWWLRAAAEIERAITAEIFPPTPSSFLCRDCEYEKACKEMGLEARAPKPVPRRLQLVSSAEMSL